MVSEQDFLKNINYQIVELIEGNNDPATAKDFIAIELNDWDKYILPLIKEFKK